MSGELGGLNTRDWHNLQDLADSLENAWKGGKPVDLKEFLPPPGSSARAAILRELIKTDLECRWRRGHPVVLDYYLEQFSDDLGGAQTLPADLVLEEYRVRQAYGDRPALSIYKKRFPDQFEEVERLSQQLPKTIVRAEDAPPSSPPPPTAPAPSPPGAAQIPGLSKDVVLAQAGGYVLIERIGRGTFGEVWKARAPGGVEKAIKIIGRAIDHVEAQREIEAMELIKNLRHHFLLKIDAYWPLEDRLIILMDLADGSLRDCLNQCKKAGKQALPLEDLLRYMRQSAEALDYLHAKKVQHRDIKPENILISEGNVRVADFGLAKTHGTRHMAAGSFAGTPPYMPPEAWNDQTHLHGDQFSLAATYYEMRTGRRLYKGSALPALMQSILHEPPKVENVDTAERDVLLRALARDADERFPCCLAFVEALVQAAAPAPASPPTSGASQADSVNVVDTDVHTILPGPRWNKPDTQAELLHTARSAMTASGVIPLGTTVEKRSRWVPAIAVAASLALVAVLAWVFVVPYFTPGTLTLEPPEPRTVHAGDEEALTLTIRRDHLTGPVTFAFVHDDLDIILNSEDIPADGTSARVKVSVAGTAKAGKRTIAVTASAGDSTARSDWELTVAPLRTLPPPAPAGAFRPSPGTEIVSTKDGKKYYKHIECDLVGEPVRFVFIPWEEKGKASFYLMVDKVANAQFGKFAERHPVQVRWSRWHLGARMANEGPSLWSSEWSCFLGCLAARPWGLHVNYALIRENPYAFPHPRDLGSRDGKLPVLRVEVPEAHAFAEWLGGVLPSEKEWDKAAGRFEKIDDFPDWNEHEIVKKGWEDGGVAIDAGKPLPVGSSHKDRSRLGCNDMAGNGYEWTRTYRAATEEEFLGNLAPLREHRDAYFYFRGQRYDASEPLTIQNLGKRLNLRFWEDRRTFSDRPTLAQMGFRVTVKPAQ